MRIFLVTFVLACAAFWGLAELMSAGGGAIQVADAPASGVGTVPDTFQPVIDEQKMTSTQIRVLKAAAKENAAKKAESAKDDENPVWKDLPDHLKKDVKEASARLEKDPCDRAASKKLRGAFEAIAKIRPWATQGPGAVQLADQKQWDAMCANDGMASGSGPGGGDP